MSIRSKLHQVQLKFEFQRIYFQLGHGIFFLFLKNLKLEKKKVLQKKAEKKGTTLPQAIAYMKRAAKSHNPHGRHSFILQVYNISKEDETV